MTDYRYDASDNAPSHFFSPIPSPCVLMVLNVVGANGVAETITVHLSSKWVDDERVHVRHVLGERTIQYTFMPQEEAAFELEDFLTPSERAMAFALCKAGWSYPIVRPNVAEAVWG